MFTKSTEPRKSTERLSLDASLANAKKPPFKQINILKDPKEINQIIREKNKSDIIKTKLSEKKREIEITKEEIKKLFTKSNDKETELKNYIAELNSKMLNFDLAVDDNIDNVHKNIMSMISEIQEKIKMEINFTKTEMEKEVMSKFIQAEQNQQRQMMDKIEEQKAVFDRMNNTKNEIDKIKKHFEQTNADCEKLSKENEMLKINLQSYEEDNKSLEKKMELIKQEYTHLKKEHQELFDSQEIDDDVDNYDDSSDTENKQLCVVKNIDSRLGKKISNSLQDNNIFSHVIPKLNPNKESTNNNFSEYYFNNPDGLIESLKQNIKAVKKEYKNVHTNYIEEIKQRNEAQQLMQKCIEDLKLDINKSLKDISNFTKINHLHLVNNNKNYEDQLSAKRNNLSSLENKLQILTFVYDNAFNNTNIRKNKLFPLSN